MKSKIVADEMYKGYHCVVRYLYNETIFMESLPKEFRDIYHWYCGYVSIPKSSPLYGVDIDDDVIYLIDVHGGITYADNLAPEYEEDEFFLGFDCNHYGDNPSVQNKDFVLSECKKLVDQIIDLDK